MGRASTLLLEAAEVHSGFKSKDFVQPEAALGRLGALTRDRPLLNISVALGSAGPLG